MSARRMLRVLGVALAAGACGDITAVGSQDGMPTEAAANRIESGHFRAAPEIAFEDLGTFGAPNANGRAINQRGDVVGHTFTTGVPDERGFLWSPGEGYRDLGTLGGTQSFANGINARGDVVGRAARATEPNRAQAFLWTRSAGMIDLLPDVDVRTEAFAINNRGDVAGTIGNLFLLSGPRAFVWSERQGLTELGNLPGGGGAVARAINDRGQVVGEASAGPDAPGIHGFLWSKQSGMTDLGYMGTINSQAGPRAINERGHVVGNRVLDPPSEPGANRRAVFWTPAEGFLDLLPPGALSSVALGINNRDEVVGAYFYEKDGLPVARAFLWSATYGFVTLPERAEIGTQAQGINDAGDIVGFSRGGGQVHAVVWHVGGGRP